VKRIECLAAIYDLLAECVVVTNMGAVAAELYTLGHRANFFYLQHAMGLASSMGLGIALVQPERRVMVLDGDGSVLMNLGGLTTLARYAPPNLTHIIFDNESLLSVGGFPTSTATGSDLAGVARAAGIGQVYDLRDLSAFEAAARAAVGAEGLGCLVAKVEAVGPAIFHMDLHLLENRFDFARALRLPEAAPLPSEPPRPAGRSLGPITPAPTVARPAHPQPEIREEESEEDLDVRILDVEPLEPDEGPDEFGPAGPPEGGPLPLRGSRSDGDPQVHFTPEPP
jgi:sulfopyruvate decarboxylase subunit beta